MAPTRRWLDRRPLDRRRFLRGLGTIVATGTLAGCTGDETDGSGVDSGDDASGGGSSPTSTPTATRQPGGTGGESPTGTGTATEDTVTADDLDLREANVTGVEFENRSGREFRFSVTLYHDDDGEDGYANWWQVETLEGEQLGRRKLLHAHGTEEFTRSETIEVPEGLPCVVVRGHDQTHGYGGQAMLVNLETGATTTARQGSDRRSFAAADCP